MLAGRIAEPASTGNPGDFDSLFRIHYPALTRLAWRVLGDSGWAEEVAAEALWKFHRHPPRRSANLAGWLYRTALHLALDQLKERRRRTRYESLAPPPNPLQSPEESFQLSERRERVRLTLAALKPAHASLLILRGEGYTLAEIAALLNLHPPSVGTFLARADQAFRKEYLSRYGPL